MDVHPVGDFEGKYEIEYFGWERDIAIDIDFPFIYRRDGDRFYDFDNWIDA